MWHGSAKNYEHKVHKSRSSASMNYEATGEHRIQQPNAMGPAGSRQAAPDLQ